jgi:hypothetical protein
MKEKSLFFRPAIWLTLALAVVMSSTGLANQSSLHADQTQHSQAQFSEADEQGRYVYMIRFAEAGLLEQFRQTRSDGERFDFRAPDMTSAREQLQAQQAAHLSAMSDMIGRQVDASHHYLVTQSGTAARLTADEARRIQRVPGVVSVERERMYELDLFRGPEFIEAPTVWSGSSTPDGLPYRGEGMIAAILDTGIQTGGHAMFDNDPACGHGDTLPDKLLSAVDCSSTDTSGQCDGANPLDTNSHGSHVAGIAVGNLIDATAVPAPNLPDGFDEMSGVAHCGHIRSYKVCPGQSCPQADLVAGLENVLIDGDPHVMNYSISGGQNPWTDNDRLKLDLVDEGIFVAASSGNTSATTPDPIGTVNHRGPWVTSVANSTHDVISAFNLSLDGGPSDRAALQGTGPAMTSTYTGQLRFAGDVDPANVEGCSAFPADSFEGEAALIVRGTCPFADKVNNAVAAGADYVVVYNNAGGPPIVMGGLEQTSVSSVMVDNVAGADLIAALDGGTEEVTVIPVNEVFQLPQYGDVLNAGSLRGSNTLAAAGSAKARYHRAGNKHLFRGRHGQRLCFPDRHVDVRPSRGRCRSAPGAGSPGLDAN